MGLINSNILGRNAGEQVYIDSTMTVRTAKYLGSVVSNDAPFIGVGMYVCLNGYTYDGDLDNKNALVLLMRIE